MNGATSIYLKLAVGLLLCASVAHAQDYASTWGPEVGAPMPLLEAPDQTEKLRTLADLAGEQGLLLFLSRSADW